MLYLIWKLAVTRTASVRSWRLNSCFVPWTAIQVRALRMTAVWKTRQPVTLLRTTPVLANPAMKWRRHGQPQKMEMKTMMNVVILAMCSTSAPPLGPELETWVLGIFGLYSSSNMLKTRCNDSNSNDVSISLPHNKDSSLPRQNNYGEFHLLKPNFTSVIF